MDKLTKYRESFCEDCMLWIYVENCKTCLFNLLKDDRRRTTTSRGDKSAF